MIFCKALDKSFETKDAMFKELNERKEELFALKKAAIKETDGIDLSILKSSAEKAAGERKLAIGDTVSNVINTTNYFDSHEDVHGPNVWDKSVEEQQGLVYHVADHELKSGKVVSYPNEVKMVLKQMSWRDLGLNVDGITTALIYESLMTDKTNPDVFKAYRDKAPVQHSIRMQYVNIKLAVNDPEYKEGFALYNTILPTIINRAKVEENGYFFYVSEAKIYKEGSTVLFGSNDITPFLGFKNTLEEPQESTQKEPSFDFLAACKGFKLSNN